MSVRIVSLIFKHNFMLPLSRAFNASQCKSLCACIGSFAFFLSSKLRKLQNSKLNVSSVVITVRVCRSFERAHTHKHAHRYTPIEIAQQVESVVIDLHSDTVELKNSNASACCIQIHPMNLAVSFSFSM